MHTATVIPAKAGIHRGGGVFISSTLNSYVEFPPVDALMGA